MKPISILGSTGSIGTQTLDIIRQHPDKFKVVALACNSNIGLLKEQIDEFQPEIVAVYDEEKADHLDTDIPIYKGMDGLLKVAKLGSAKMVVNALVGSIGVLPTLKAIENLKEVALANKETLVTAGQLVKEELRKRQTRLIPIDSEHSAILQCINGEELKDVSKIMITCSGGAFKNRTKQELETVTAQDALQHPTWDMGPKITIDCATLMNKGLEVIEAHWLYGIPYQDIEVVIHPQSIIHSLVEFKDKSIKAQLGLPDMRIPIQYALGFPKRLENNFERLDLAKIRQLDFKEPNLELFPCLKYAYEAGITGGTMPAVMNAANEVAVDYFLQNKIHFLDINYLIKSAMENHTVIRNPNLKEILEVDQKTKEDIKRMIDCQ